MNPPSQGTEKVGYKQEPKPAFESPKVSRVHIYMLAHQSKVFLLGFRDRIQHDRALTIGSVCPGFHVLLFFLNFCAISQFRAFESGIQ